MTTTGSGKVAQEFLTTQVELLEAGNTAALALRYAEDAVFVRLDITAVGRAQIKQLFDDYLTKKPTIQSVAGVQITDDTLLYQADELLDGRLVTAVGTLVFRDELVWRQTVAFVEQQPSR